MTSKTQTFSFYSEDSPSAGTWGFNDGKRDEMVSHPDLLVHPEGNNSNFHKDDGEETPQWFMPLKVMRMSEMSDTSLGQHTYTFNLHWKYNCKSKTKLALLTGWEAGEGLCFCCCNRYSGWKGWEPYCMYPYDATLLAGERKQLVTQSATFPRTTVGC